MLGWMLIFVVMILGGLMTVIDGGIGGAVGMGSTIVFGFLLVLSAFSLLLRSRA